MLTKIFIFITYKIYLNVIYYVCHVKWAWPKDKQNFISTNAYWVPQSAGHCGRWSIDENGPIPTKSVCSSRRETQINILLQICIIRDRGERSRKSHRKDDGWADSAGSRGGCRWTSGTERSQAERRTHIKVLKCGVNTEPQVVQHFWSNKWKEVAFNLKS